LKGVIVELIAIWTTHKVPALLQKGGYFLGSQTQYTQGVGKSHLSKVRASNT
jgi:hypothetical protein